MLNIRPHGSSGPTVPEHVSVLDVLTSTMGALPVFNIMYFAGNGRLKDRVLKHDLLHVLLIDRNWPVRFRYEDEYSAAIVQAVLMRDSSVSAQSISRTEAPRNQVPTPHELAERTLPGVVAFLRTTFRRLGIDIPKDFRQPDMCFISKYYILGQLFEQAFHKEFAVDYASIRAETLKDTPFLRVADSFDRAVNAYAVCYGH